ncbi:RNA-binding S4 domain-containing protein [Ideonella dechloratans]|uniref:RNA-binding S4 domain-containing protein n=1 Tax=Ideonella dechloratans TaxID=36863 RepID=A0A643FAT9_IDEDE|nr:RNA-binding S4 domain-containing protein [Ideonella dechloratans]KAB0580918.1 RNA-binding S4 domain-containing protein [Ideonella dechloratans]UFU08831.1 RNA-binding S4 domain-containing protein [Ideonella dechloratans]
MAEPRPELTGVRLDKWLWAARFFKTRALAVEAIGKNRVEVNAQPAKPGREVRPGDTLLLREPGMPPRELRVLGLSQVRGPAPVAQQLYEETASSLSAREAAREARRQGVEPAQTLTQGRPTKRDRRQLSDWNRWSASVDDESP